MDYAGLFQAVREQLSLDHSFCIEVRTWRHRSSREPETAWEIYVCAINGNDDCQRFHGATAQEVFDAFMKPEEADAETLDQTSAAVGDATVDA